VCKNVLANDLAFNFAARLQTFVFKST